VRHKIEAASRKHHGCWCGQVRLHSTEAWHGSNCKMFEWSWAAHRQLKWRWCQAKQRIHISRLLAVRMRRASAAVLAHSLDVGGRKGQWARKAACEWLRPLPRASDRMCGQERAGEGGRKKGRVKGTKHPPIFAFPRLSPYRGAAERPPRPAVVSRPPRSGGLC